MKTTHLSLLIGFALALVLPARSAEQDKVTVAAGEFDRMESVVSFVVPENHRTASGLIDESGGFAPLQIDEAGRGYFVVHRLAKGKKASFTFAGPTPAADAAASQVDVRKDKDGQSVSIKVHGRPLLHYQGGKGELPRPDIRPVFRRGGYIHPLFTPTGTVVTDDYPRNHLHHHGIWFAWTHTEFEGRHPDFWNMGDGTGTVEFVGLGGTLDGPVYGGFQAHHRFVDLSAPQPKTVLDETWSVIAYNLGPDDKPLFVFDLISVQNCATADPLKLPQYRYGGIGFRGRWEWNGKGNARFLTSDGETDRVKGNFSRGRWCYIGGPVTNGLAGVTIFCHPNNFRAPQPMRIHPTEPFFCFAPQQIGDMQITPGETYISRYRFFVADGQPDPKTLERLWNDYAEPPTVAVVSH